MNFEEELIESVKRYPILFDPSEKEYRNKTARNEAWEEIGQILGRSGDECRELWIKLRNAYTNAMKRRKSKSGHGAKILFKWKYEEEMGFLAQTLEHRTADGYTEAIEEGLMEGEEIPQGETFSSSTPPVSIEEIISPYSPPPLPLSTSQSSRFWVPTTRSKKARIEKSISEMVALMKENSRVNAQTSSNDMDMFFFSLSKTVQKLSPEEQLRVKMEVGNVVFHAEFQELQRLREQQKQRNPPYQTDIHPPTCSNIPVPPNLQNMTPSQSIRVSSHSPSPISSSSHDKSPSPAPKATEIELSYIEI